MNQLKRVTLWLLFLACGPLLILSIYFSPSWDYLTASPWDMVSELNHTMLQATPLVMFVAAVHGSTVDRYRQLDAERRAARLPWALVSVDIAGVLLAVASGWALAITALLVRSYADAAPEVDLPITMVVSSLVMLLVIAVFGVGLGRAAGKLAGPTIALFVGLSLYLSLPEALVLTPIDPYDTPSTTVSWERLALSVLVLAMSVLAATGAGALRIAWLRRRGTAAAVSAVGILGAVLAWGFVASLPSEVPRAQPSPVCERVPEVVDSEVSVCVWPEHVTLLPELTSYAQTVVRLRDFAGVAQVDLNEKDLERPGQQFYVGAYPEPDQMAFYMMSSIVPTFLEQECPHASEQDILRADAWFFAEALDKPRLEDRPENAMIGDFVHMSPAQREVWLQDNMPSIAACLPYSDEYQPLIGADGEGS